MHSNPDEPWDPDELNALGEGLRQDAERLGELSPTKPPPDIGVAARRAAPRRLALTAAAASFSFASAMAVWSLLQPAPPPPRWTDSQARALPAAPDAGDAEIPWRELSAPELEALIDLEGDESLPISI